MTDRRAIAWSVSTALLLAGAAFLQGNGSAPEERADTLAAALGLTAAQSAAVARLEGSLAARSRPLVERSERQVAEIHRLLASAAPDAAEVGEKVIAAHRTRLEIERLRAEIRARLRALLTPEQQARLRGTDHRTEPAEQEVESDIPGAQEPRT
jgi:Spy/CpxP family protein refolding chaperone